MFLLFWGHVLTMWTPVPILDCTFQYTCIQSS